MPLTDAAVRNAKPTTKVFNLHDSGGLYMTVSPSGGKWWRLRYRFGGKENRISVGIYPEVSLNAARERRDRERALLASGVDPSLNRRTAKLAQASRNANNFEQVTREWFAKFSPGWVAAHAARKLRLFERNIFPWIGQRPIAEITEPELLSVLRRIEKRGALVMEHRARVYVSQVYRFAIADGRAKTDPSRDLQDALAPKKKTVHFPAITDPKKLGELLRTIDSYEGTAVVRAALCLAPLLAVRPGELRQAKWQDFDLDHAEWRYVASKTNPDHLVPLSKQALKLLRELHNLTGSGEYAFPGARSAKRPMSDMAINAALRRLEVPADLMSCHGFRATFKTVGEEILKFPPHLVEHQLAHRVQDPLGRAYNRTKYLAERRLMMQTWSNFLDGLKRGKVLAFHAVA